MRIKRREFLSLTAGCGVMSLGLLPGRLNAQQKDYKALVCIDLKGGNDAYNMLVPADSLHYKEYNKSRSLLAVEQSDLLKIPQSSFDGNNKPVQFGLHPAMQALQPVFQAGKANVILNSGVLQQPLTKHEIESGAKQKPPQLFSHNSQRSEWHRGAVNHRIKLGWAGRMMDVISEQQGFSALYSLSGNALILRAMNSEQNILRGDKVAKVAGIQNRAILRSYKKLLAKDPSSPFHAEINKAMQASLSSSSLLSEALNRESSFKGFSGSSLDKQLAAVFKLISQQQQLGQHRQVFYVTLSGFDTHDDQLERHPLLLKELSDSLATFNRALQSIDYQDKVVTFTQSEFGRRIAPNYTGTDHGWGGHQLIMGGGLRAEKAIGVWPSLKVSGEDDISKGRMIPSIGSDQVAAALAEWMGVKSAKAMRVVLPNIDNFKRLELGLK